MERKVGGGGPEVILANWQEVLDGAGMETLRAHRDRLRGLHEADRDASTFD
jgi:hypothetical protein